MNYSEENANRIWKSICEEIKMFQNNINHNEEVALLIANLGQSVTLRLKAIGLLSTYLTYFKGTIDNVDNVDCQVIQHIEQVNFLMMPVPKANAHELAYHIPF